jgi:hypothetical protein
MALSDSQPAAPLASGVRRRDLRPVAGLPQLPESPSPHAVLTTPVDRTEVVGSTSPSALAFPEQSAGRRPQNYVSRPAQASLVLRPAELLTHHTWALSRGSGPTSYSARPLVSYQGIPTTPWVGPSPTGVSRHWGARRVEDGRGYSRRSRGPVSHPRSSNRTCRFPASGFPTGFTAGSRESVRLGG